MRRVIVRHILLSAWFIVQGAAVALGQSQPTVRLSDWEQAGNGTGVRFVALSTLTDSEPTPSRFSDQTQNGLFQYDADLSELRWADACRCFRYYIVVVRSTATGLVTRHKFKALPSGTFDDQRADVTLTITQGDQTDTDKLSLPVGSAPGLQPNALQLATVRSVESVVLAGDTDLRLIMQNNSSMDVVIPTLAVVADRNDLWVSAPAVQGLGTPLQVLAHQSLQVRVHVSPRTKAAIGVSWPPTESGQHHTNLIVEASYENPVFQNRRAKTSLVVPIRFQPNLGTLASTLFLGVMIGTLVLLLTKRVNWGRKYLQATGVALLVAIVFELLGIVLVAGGSKFVLFGYSIDPWQTVPVILLGVGVGLLGTKSADQLTKAFKWQ